MEKNIHIVLFEPEIPQNTGNIMRTCVAIGATLHIIEPMGFIFDNKKLKRSGMDYIDQLDLVFHDDYASFLSQMNGKLYFITRYGKNVYSDVVFNDASDEPIFLMFGKESTGIPLPILRSHQDVCLRIPMVETARSLNLSNCVALVAYECLRQLNFEGLSVVEVQKGENWLDQSIAL